MKGALGGAWILGDAALPGRGHPSLPSAPQAGGGGRNPTLGGVNGVSPPEAPTASFSLQEAPRPSSLASSPTQKERKHRA